MRTLLGLTLLLAIQATPVGAATHRLILTGTSYQSGWWAFDAPSPFAALAYQPAELKVDYKPNDLIVNRIQLEIGDQSWIFSGSSLTVTDDIFFDAPDNSIYPSPGGFDSYTDSVSASGDLLGTTFQTPSGFEYTGFSFDISEVRGADEALPTLAENVLSGESIITAKLSRPRFLPAFSGLTYRSLGAVDGHFSIQPLTIGTSIIPSSYSIVSIPEPSTAVVSIMAMLVGSGRCASDWLQRKRQTAQRLER
ncbi:MAG: hypothetical protein AAGB29_02430 [Planctomycetota bacterium]